MSDQHIRVEAPPGDVLYLLGGMPALGTRDLVLWAAGGRGDLAEAARIRYDYGTPGYAGPLAAAIAYQLHERGVVRIAGGLPVDLADAIVGEARRRLQALVTTGDQPSRSVEVSGVRCQPLTPARGDGGPWATPPETPLPVAV
jgi:hypothetical protein